MPKRRNPIWDEHAIILESSRQVTSGSAYIVEGSITPQSLIFYVMSVPLEVGALGDAQMYRMRLLLQLLLHILRFHKRVVIPLLMLEAALRRRIFLDRNLLHALPPPTTDHHGPPLHSESHKQSTFPGAGQAKLSWVRERQRIAEIEIGRIVVECNLSFNVLRTDQWRRMVRSIAAAGPCDTWCGVDYRSMHTKILDDERALTDQALHPMREAWARYGCSIISYGWTGTRKRGIINILSHVALVHTSYMQWM